MHIRKLGVIFWLKLSCVQEVNFGMFSNLLKKKKPIAYLPTFIFHRISSSVSIENSNFNFDLKFSYPMTTKA